MIGPHPPRSRSFTSFGCKRAHDTQNMDAASSRDFLCRFSSEGGENCCSFSNWCSLFSVVCFVLTCRLLFLFSFFLFFLLFFCFPLLVFSLLCFPSTSKLTRNECLQANHERYSNMYVMARQNRRSPVTLSSVNPLFSAVGGGAFEKKEEEAC